MQIKRLMLGAALAGAAFSGAAMAGVTGNVGVVSEYVYRGVSQGTGGDPAVQGGIDYAHDSGFYAGVWSSSLAGGTGSGTGSYEIDGYLGFGGTAGSFGYDIGALYYGYPKSKEAGGADIGTLEFHIKGSVGPVAVTYNYSDDWFDSGESAQYVNGALSLPISETLSFDLAVGYSFGDYYKAADAEYVDYGVSLSKTLNEGLSASFAIVGSDIDGDDDPRFIVGAKYDFSL